MTEQEFNHTILPLAKNVYSYALHMTGNPEDASDITQDAMVKAWDKRQEFRKINHPKAWLLTMARNLCLDWLKKQKPIYNAGQLLQNEAIGPDLFREIEVQDMARIVRQIIYSLPDQQREVMILRELEEMEFEEISEITGLTLNHIRVLLSRGRTKVKEKLKSE